MTRVIRHFPRRISAVAGAVLALTVLAAQTAAIAQPTGDGPAPIARGSRVSGVAQASAHRLAAGGTLAASVIASCNTPGLGNFRTDCASSGAPVSETWIASDGSQFVAGANDYNSYNGQGQDGYYWSSDGRTWNDAGPIDIFPHNPNNGAGDPGLALDGTGVVYYSSLFFNFNQCNVGGVELLRRDPSTGSWSRYEIAQNSSTQFQDKPAIAVGGGKVFVSWTQFGYCSGAGVTSPIKVAVFGTGASSVAPDTVLSVPGSTYSQGSSIAGDGADGFWVAWEEYASASATVGSIKLAHWSAATGWGVPQTISPAGFVDLPSPLLGFSFRDNSFPALAVVGAAPGTPNVSWTSYDSGVGRAYLYDGTTVSVLSDAGGDQFFPAIAADGAGGVFVSFSQVNPGTASYDEYVVHGTLVTKVSTASSYPNMDAFFSGQFIGDYNGISVSGGIAYPIWTDVRGPDPNYQGYETDSMVAAPPRKAHRKR